MLGTMGRELWIDVLRAFACICVLLVHSPAVYDGRIPGQFVLAPFNYVFMAWGVSIFFMISGALLFTKEQQLVPFFKKRFARILVPTILWSLIYLIFIPIYEHSDINLFHKLFLLPFTPQYGLMWFMYALVGIYLITPMISTWLSKATKNDVEIVLAAWGITLFFPYFELFDVSINNAIMPNGSLYYFYGFIGYYLKTYNPIHLKSLTYIVLVIVAFSFPFIVFFSNWIPIKVLNSSQSISAALMSTIAFIFFQNIDYQKIENNKWFLKMIESFAACSFGIYLLHMVFLYPLKHWLTSFHINYIIQIPITALLVGVVSFAVVWFLSKNRVSKFLFG